MIKSRQLEQSLIFLLGQCEFKECIVKVLQINSFFSVGGPPRIVNGIYDTLISEGHECKIAAARERMYAPKDSIQIDSNFGVKINALKARLFDNEGFNARRATKKLIKEIEAYNPDVIHLHNLHGYYINIEILFNYLKRSNKPVVWTLHDCWAFTGHCAYFDYVQCEKWKTGCFKCVQKDEYPRSMILDKSKQNYCLKKQNFNKLSKLMIVPVSKWLDSILKQSFLSKQFSQVIYNGIDLSVFYKRESLIRKKLSLGNKKVLLGVAQRWERRKGLKDFELLNSHLDHEKYVIILIGLSEKERKGLPQNIICINRTNSKEELAEYYSMADVFLNLSYEETFGLVTLEAMACGTPVIVYDRTAVPEIVDETCGEIVSAGNIDELAKKVEIIDKLSKTDACVRKAQEFDYKNCYKKYVQLYEKLCRQGAEIE